MITITEKASEMLRKQSSGDRSYLRIRVKSGGCAGMTYDAELDSVKHDDESIVQTHAGIVVISNAESLQFLEGLSIDYSDDLISGGFRFNNDSNESSCGCGASFALAGFPEINGEAVSCGT
jgi:iron-sulfur cluster assembly protein